MKKISYSRTAIIALILSSFTINIGFADGLHFGLPGGIKERVKELDEKVREKQAEEARKELMRVPNTPTLITPAVAEDIAADEITLHWEDTSDNESIFIIERAIEVPAALGTWEEIARVPENETQFTDTDIRPDTIYWYRIKAMSNTGVISPWSQSIRFQTAPAMPEAPSSLIATIFGTEVTLSWKDNSDNEESFLIETLIQDDGIGTWVSYAHLPADTVSYSIKDVVRGEIHYYRVRAINNTVSSEHSHTVNVFIKPLQIKPSMPRDLIAVAKEASITVSWLDTSDNEESFILAMCLDDGGSPNNDWAESTYPSETYSVTLRDLLLGTTYWFQVKARNGAGDSEYTQPKSVYLQDTHSQGMLPLAPSNLEVAIDGMSILLSWDDNSDNEDYFIVERSDGDSGNWIVLNTVSVSSFEDTSITEYGDYWYRVKADNSVGDSRYSNTAHAPVLDPSKSPPAMPYNVEAEASDNAVTVSWEHSGDFVDTFIVSICRDADGVPDTQWIEYTVLSDTLQLKIDKLVVDRKYWLTVRAHNTSGDSDATEAFLVHILTGQPKPNAPSNLQAIVDDQTVTLTWVDQSSDETLFIVQFRAATSSTWESRQYDEDVTSAEFRELPYYVTYEYRVQAVNEYGESEFSDILSIYINIPGAPHIPGNVRATVSDNTVELTWSDDSNGENWFVVQSRISTSSLWVESVTGKGINRLLFTNLTYDMEYVFKIKAVNDVGESLYSEPISKYINAPIDLPQAPDNLRPSFIFVEQFAIVLTWDDLSDTEAQFVIERANTQDEWIVIDTTHPNDTEYVDTNVDGSGHYWYRVKAVNIAGSSPYSNILEIDNPGTIPQAPSNLRPLMITSSTIQLQWDDMSTNESGFVIERAHHSSVTQLPSIWRVVSTLDKNNTVFIDEDVFAFGDYWYRVKAVNIFGDSEYTPAIRIDVYAVLPNKPHSLSTDYDGSQILLSWYANDETYFRVDTAADIDGVPSDWQALVSLAYPNNSSYVSHKIDDFDRDVIMWYRVAALNVQNETVIAASDFSTPAYFKIDEYKPDAPNDVRFSVHMDEHFAIRLRWNDTSNTETGFIVERALDNEGVPGSWEQIGDTQKDIAEYTDTNVQITGNYWYRILAVSDIGNSSYSQALHVDLSIFIPRAPTNLMLTFLSPISLRLEWTDRSHNETNFLVERAFDDNGMPGVWESIAETPENSYSRVLTDITHSGNYWFRLNAKNIFGSSEYSNELHVDMSALLPSTPTNFVAEVDDSEVQLSWEPNGETTFVIEVALDQDGVPGEWAKVTQIDTIADDTHVEHRIEGVPLGTIQWYRVAAVVMLDQTLSRQSIFSEHRQIITPDWVDVDGVGQRSPWSLFLEYPIAEHDEMFSMTLDSSGNPHIIWQDIFNYEYIENLTTKYRLVRRVKYLKWNDIEKAWVDVDGSGTESATVSTSDSVPLNPSIACDSNGRPHLVWQEGVTRDSGGIYEIFYGWWDTNTNSWEKVNISNTDANSVQPLIKVDANNNIHVVWTEETTSNKEIFYVFKNNTTSGWSVRGDSLNISNTDTDSLSPSLAINNEGVPMIAWQESVTSTNKEIYLIAWDAENSIWEHKGISLNVSNNSTNSITPSLAIDSHSNPHLAWEDIALLNHPITGQSRISNAIVYMRWDSNSNQWVDALGNAGALTAIHNQDAFLPASPSLAVDGDDIPHVAWEHRDGGDAISYLKWSAHREQWVDSDGVGTGQRKILVHDLSLRASTPTLALDMAGKPHIAYFIYQHDAPFFKGVYFLQRE